MAKTELAKTPNDQKRQPTKTLAIKMDFAKQNHKRPKRKFWRNWLWPKTDKANEAETILQTQFARTFAEKRQADFENLYNRPRTKPKPRNKANQNQRWPKHKLKTSKPISVTRPNQPKLYWRKKICWTEKQELENLLAENQSQTRLEKTPPLKNEIEFLSQSQKQNLRIKDGFAFALWLASQLCLNQRLCCIRRHLGGYTACKLHKCLCTALYA